MNAYFAHMLERAREVDQWNKGETTRDSVVKCPFCIADEDETWFQRTLDAGEKYKKTDPLRPKPLKLKPHCHNCPLQSLFGIKLPELMNDCVEKGFYALRHWEDTDE